MKDTKHYTSIGVAFILVLIATSYTYTTIFSIPKNFPVEKTFTVNENETLQSISRRLQEEMYINSPLLFRAGISFVGKDTTIQLGRYVFTKPLSLFGVVTTFVTSSPDAPLLSVTIPEGSTSREIISIIKKALPALTISAFNEMIIKYGAEGRLFPSTYFLLPSYNAEDIVKIMIATFSKKVAPFELPKTIQKPLHTENDILVLASILEGEAQSQQDMKIVSGILRSRLTKGMLLQVDVAKETYIKKGLPPVPINNPGLVAIEAALYPIDTPYLYYITGNDGAMYYAKTFEEHKKNIRKYLR